MNATGDMPDRTVMALPAHWYHDESIYARERRAIFAREWLWVGRVEQVAAPGDYLACEPAGFPIFVRRDGGGNLRGFHNVCRHRASQVVLEEQGHCEQLVCPYHGWRYADDGALQKAPRFGGAADFDPADYGLFPIQVATWLGLVFICLDLDAEPFDAWFGPLRERIESFLDDAREFHGDLVADVPVNWKNYVDNYQEGYHIPLVHPQLAHDTEWEAYRVVNLPGGSIHEVPPRGDSAQPGLFGWKYPNLAFNTYGRGVSFLRFEPRGPSACRLVYSHFRPRGMDPAAYERQVVAYGWQISEEDQSLTPLVQTNLEAGIYISGPLSPRHENGLWYFHRLVRDALARVRG